MYGLVWGRGWGISAQASGFGKNPRAGTNLFLRPELWATPVYGQRPESGRSRNPGESGMPLSESPFGNPAKLGLDPCIFAAPGHARCDVTNELAGLLVDVMNVPFQRYFSWNAIEACEALRGSGACEGDLIGPYALPRRSRHNGQSKNRKCRQIESLAPTMNPGLVKPLRHVVTLVLLFLCPAIGHAADEKRAGAHETVIAGDYFGAGTNASLGTPVEGDAFVAGAQVELNKPVNGDALLAGGGVSISDRVGGDLYATGGSVTIDAPVAGNARLAGGRVEITNRGQVSGKTTLVGGRVTVLGKAGRQLVVFGEHVTLDGEVAGNVPIPSRTLSIGPDPPVAASVSDRGSVPAPADPAAAITCGL